MGSDAFLRIRLAGDLTVKEGFRIEPRRISDYEIVCFPAGSGTVYSVSGIEYELSRPCAIITRPGEPNAYRFDPDRPTRHMFVHFEFGADGVAARYPLLADGAPLAVTELAGGSLIPQMMKQLFACLYKKPPRWRMQSETLLLVVLEELENVFGTAGREGETSPLPGPLAEAVRAMEARLPESVEIERVAQSVGWSHEHLTRTFRRHFGQSPKEWLTRRRIEHGARLLLERTDTVKQIARSSGFADEYYFHRLFRRHMGMTASEYRRRYRDPRLRELAPPDDATRTYPVNFYFTMRDESAD